MYMDVIIFSLSSRDMDDINASFLLVCVYIYIFCVPAHVGSNNEAKPDCSFGLAEVFSMIILLLLN